MTDPNQPKTMEENDMTKDELISLNALRIMRAYPAVYGRGPWTESLLEYGFLCGLGWHPLIGRPEALPRRAGEGEISLLEGPSAGEG